MRCIQRPPPMPIRRQSCKRRRRASASRSPARHKCAYASSPVRRRDHSRRGRAKSQRRDQEGAGHFAHPAPGTAPRPGTIGALTANSRSVALVSNTQSGCGVMTRLAASSIVRQHQCGQGDGGQASRSCASAAASSSIRRSARRPRAGGATAADSARIDGMKPISARSQFISCARSHQRPAAQRSPQPAAAQPASSHIETVR